jgi:hypothetical protein
MEAAPRLARLEADQRRDHLQIVLHAVLHLQQQHVLGADLLLHILQRLLRGAGLDQGDQPEGRRAVAVFDQVRVDVDRDRLVPAPFKAIEAGEIAGADNRRAEVAPRLVALAAGAQHAPRLPDHIGGGEPGAGLEFEVGVDDTLPVAGLGDQDGDRHMVEKLAERLAFERTGQVGHGHDGIEGSGRRRSLRLRTRRGFAILLRHRNERYDTAMVPRRRPKAPAGGTRYLWRSGHAPVAGRSDSSRNRPLATSFSHASPAVSA